MSYPNRLDAAQYAGYRLYSLTFGAHRRARLFINQSVVNLVLSQFLHTATSEGFAVIAYCCMPDHVHMLVVGRREDADLRRFVSTAKQRSGFGFARTFGARLWQKNFFDRTIRKDEDVPTIVAYMVNNPVRERMVDDPADYPYWGSQVYTREEILTFVGSSRRRR